ncbi:CU044_5270 family protein [Nonomuraea muscovyensis]|uniref:CU044_5270 family protein n=1 Tax=Nonomuraea muscovyensis TaxID=1124761 RepID=UPI0033E51E7C
MDDEIRVFAAGRPAAPPYSDEARARARDRLLREARGQARGQGGLRRPRLGRFRPGWQAVAAFGITVTLVGGVAVALSGQRTGPDAATSVTRADDAFPELHPRPGQFVLVESDTMYASLTIHEGGESRHLRRSHRKIWQSVDGSADGLLVIEGREPKPYPGETELPKDATNWRGSDWVTLAFCPRVEAVYRDSFAYLSTLPAEPAAMREQLYREQSRPSTEEESDLRAFRVAAEMLREGYLPRAQRDALYEAVRTIDGVTEVEGVADSAGRRGVALGLTEARLGVREEIIFDPVTRMMLGERATVVDESVAKAPKGGVVAHTAQLKVSVVEEVPEPPAGTPRSECMPSPSKAPSAQPTAPSDTPAAVRPSTPLPDAPDAARPTTLPADATGTPDGPSPAAPTPDVTQGPASIAPTPGVTDGPVQRATPSSVPAS